MVRLLMGMRAAQLRHGAAGGRLGLVVLLVLGAVSAIGTLALGFVHYRTADAGAAVLALVLAAWLAGRLAFAAFAGGDSALRPEIFRLLPIPRRRLSTALLVVGLVDPSLLFFAVALGSVVALGARYGALAVICAILGAVGTLVLGSVLSTLVAAASPAPSRRRRGVGTMIVALVISVVAIAGPLLPAFVAALTAGGMPVLGVVVRALPSGWAADAVAGAGTGDPLLALLPLLGLAAAVAAVGVLWPVVLGRRLDGTAAASRRTRRRAARRRVLPGTPVGAVVGKELRLWGRDPNRATLLLIAGVVGIGACVVPFVSRGTPMLMPFAGMMTTLIAGAVACNLYGTDGLALRLTAGVPGSARPDIRGRQLAWLLLVGPWAVAVTVVLTLLSGQGWAWPWVLAGLPALLGGALGIVPLASTISVQPLDESGGLGPGWPVKVYACLFCLLGTVVPAAAVLTVGGITGVGWVPWAAVPVGVGTGILCAVLLSRVAVRRLRDRQLEMIAVIARTASPA